MPPYSPRHFTPGPPFLPLPLRVPRLLDQARERIRYFHYSLKTGKSFRRPIPCAAPSRRPPICIEP
ncbi:MAG: hypothetical protein ACXW2D_04765 [Burkholderiaceae bacterium]